MFSHIYNVEVPDILYGYGIGKIKERDTREICNPTFYEGARRPRTLPPQTLPPTPHPLTRPFSFVWPFLPLSSSVLQSFLETGWLGC